MAGSQRMSICEGWLRGETRQRLPPSGGHFARSGQPPANRWRPAGLAGRGVGRNEVEAPERSGGECVLQANSVQK